MENTKFIDLLKTFDKEEIEKFSLFLKSPLFNVRETISNLYEIIKGFSPEFSGPAFSKEALFKEMYKNKPYNDELMRNMISRLYKLAESFLSFLNYQHDRFYQDYGMLIELNDRGHEKIFKKRYSEIMKQIDSETLTNTDTFLKHHRMAYLNRHHLDTFKHTHVHAEDILQQREQKLIEYFLADIMKVYSFMINQMNLYPERSYDLSMLDQIEAYITAGRDNIKNNFYLQINYNNIMLLKYKERIYFDNLRELINRYSDRLPHESKAAFYSSMNNYIQDEIFLGDQNAIYIKFELYKEMFKNEGMFWDENTVNHLDLMGAVNYSLIVKEFDEANNFLENFIGKVDIYYRESTGNYCNALIKYYKKDFDGVLKQLVKVNYNDISYKIQVKTLTFMTYYSMNEDEGFYSSADSFRHFLNDNKLISDYFKSLYMNFINFTIRLYKGKHEIKDFDIDFFKKELISAKNVAKKHWLLEMLNELSSAVINR